ncbi:DedA family protein [Rossellomorea marisflavi]|uniref:DedA family protein n=1 Tax=Rossellomorea marisflavi TaxID=189381 RepID=A0A5D4S1W1_9BACI|nr:DedA family protein [Rossellomorea marisflavi]MDW4526726.1 DedA family protein [Rossellomorea marisflavi]TYS56054.1 DedA family protein [Rossellomorea marisflavi]UKS67354.1 DedA family protein [Rossellomorea marisflavi]
MEKWIIESMEQYGYLGIFLLVALENIFPPIPSEIILTFGGFMTTTSSMTIPGVILASTAGSVAGAVILYGIGVLLSKDKLEQIVDRWGHILRVKKEDIRKADRWFDHYGYRVVLLGRMVPLIRSLISIPAGVAKMKFIYFLLFTLIGTLIWNTVLVWVGSAVGDSWDSIVQYMDVYSSVAYVLIALVLIYFAYQWTKRFKKK